MRSAVSETLGVELVGVRDVPVTENIGRGHASLAGTLQAWRASPLHAQSADGPGGPWWALVIAGDPQPDAVWR